jgi:hypothetical protein
MTRIDRNMQVGEALFILGHQDLTDVDTLIREPYRKLEAIKNFLIEKVEHYKSRTDTVPDSCYWFAYKSTLEILEGEE